MITSRLSRRSVLVGSVATTALLAGCSTTSSDHGEAADSERLRQARDLSHRMLNELAGNSSGKTDSLRTLHQQQIAQFERSASLGDARSTPTSGALPHHGLAAQERELATALQALALEADRGDVAALLASAAAGIKQTLKQVSA